MKTAAVILAAGRGSRMLASTAEKPKCLVELAGKPLLAWQLEALHKADIDKILIVRGYRAEAIQGDFETVENPAWESTNMLSSLLRANDFADSFFQDGGERLLVAYSDIVYHPDHVKAVLAAPHAVAIAYDTEWETLWRLRFEDPLADAETFTQKDGRLVEIGGKAARLSDIHGQYMGLLSFNAAGWNILRRVCGNLGETVAKTDMTAFLRRLLSENVSIGAAPVRGKWCESDNENDLRSYEKALANGNWSHDWR